MDLIFVSLALGGVALVIALVLLAVQLVSSRRHKALLRAAQEGGLPDMIASAIMDIESLKSALAQLESQNEQLKWALRAAISKAGLVRYDAFGDIGGNLSFSAALLDEKGNGLVITSISGRHESRNYAKKVVNGQSEIALSKEEQEAIAQALGS